jgi:hypothetical protein
LNYLRDVLEGGADREALAVTVGLVINAADAIRIDLGVRHGIWGENVDQRLTGTANVSMTFGGRSR